MVDLVEFLSKSPEDTVRLGKRLGADLVPGDVIALTGVIGAGKSLIAGAIAAGLGIEITMASPSFVIVASYEGAVAVNHIDLYRLGDYAEAVSAGVEEAIHSNAVNIVEWADRVPAILPTGRIDISLELREDPNERLIKIEPVGDEPAERLYDFLACILRERFR